MSHPHIRMTLARAAVAAACSLAALSQPAWADTPSAAPAAASDAKVRLAEKVVALWHPEDVVIVMVQRPAADAMQQARIALQGKVSSEKRDATLKDMATDVQKYVDQATPVARDSAQKLVGSTVVPMLVAQFSEEELHQIIALLESPVKKKFEQALPKMERALGEQVVAQSKGQIDPMLQDMTKAVGLKLRAATIAP